jgi:RNA polymerase sigma factor (sigma-70 family)
MGDKINIEKHLNWLRKIAHSYHRTYPELEFDDLFSEACLACLKELPKYNPSRGSETTFLALVAKSHLDNILTKERRWKERNIYCLEDISDIPAPEYDYEWEEFISNLSPEAQYLCNIIQQEEEISIKRPKKSHKKMIEKLQKMGWETPKIWKTTKEVKSKLHQSIQSTSA